MYLRETAPNISPAEVCPTRGAWPSAHYTASSTVRRPELSGRSRCATRSEFDGQLCRYARRGGREARGGAGEHLGGARAAKLADPRAAAGSKSRGAVLARLRAFGVRYFEFYSQLAQGREQPADGGWRAVGDAGRRPCPAFPAVRRSAGSGAASSSGAPVAGWAMRRPRREGRGARGRRHRDRARQRRIRSSPRIGVPACASEAPGACGLLRRRERGARRRRRSAASLVRAGCPVSPPHAAHAALVFAVDAAIGASILTTFPRRSGDDPRRRRARRTSSRRASKSPISAAAARHSSRTRHARRRRSSRWHGAAARRGAEAVEHRAVHSRWQRHRRRRLVDGDDQLVLEDLQRRALGRRRHRLEEGEIASRARRCDQPSRAASSVVDRTDLSSPNRSSSALRCFDLRAACRM